VRQSLFFLCGTLLLAALMLLALEGGVRLTGLAGTHDPRDAASRLPYQQVLLPVFAEETRPDGTRVLETHDPRLPYQQVLHPKPEGTLRVVAFGGSATAGLGFSPNVTFARYLERMWREAAPDQELEVVNLGVVALASKQVRRLVDDVIENAAPDLLLVYSGNNEFLEIHAERYAEAHANSLERFRSALARTHLFRLLKPLVGAPAQVAPTSTRDLARGDLRLTQDEIIRDIELDEEDRRDVVDAYALNLDHIAQVALQAEVPLVLMSVASNWQWRGREDLPGDYVMRLAPASDLEPAARREAALETLDRRIDENRDEQRHEWLFQRATLLAEDGDWKAAARDYRAAMNADPHLRRALDAMNEQVERVATNRSATFFDTVGVLEGRGPQPVVGFADFYDYVHMTPRGAVSVAAELFDVLRAEGFVQDGGAYSSEHFVRQEEARIAALERDALSLDLWLGVGHDVARIEDRDLWKYQAMREELDQRIARDPKDFEALVYRGNARAHEPGGAAGAVDDYRAALEIHPGHPIVSRNLARVRLERGAR
jgi:tetratricopeptide (TPR) repeat protein